MLSLEFSTEFNKMNYEKFLDIINLKEISKFLKLQ